MCVQHVYVHVFVVIVCACVYQVLVERDQASKEVSRLMSELESLKDHNVQLADRAANYQVQAKAKEVSPSWNNVHLLKKSLKIALLLFLFIRLF